MKSFLFDLDGTLVVTDNIYLRIWSEILKPYNIDVDIEFYNTHIQGNNDANVIAKLIPQASLDEISNQKNELFDKHIEHVVTIPNSIEFISFLKQQGHKVAIVTNCNRVNAESILTHIDLFKYIDLINI